ncbi:MAG TPA: hypothetical protein PKD49_03250 [Hyphomicrobium sp.]|nr:hypothetical protein [Hyphomicrobium sp.]
MKHATLFYKMLVVYVFAFLATIIFPIDRGADVRTAQAPAKVATSAKPQGAVLVKASASEAIAPVVSHSLSSPEPVTISH